MVLLTIISLISALAFTLCTFTSLFFIFMGNLPSSLGFAIMAGVWFVLMVVFGYVYINRSR